MPDDTNRPDCNFGYVKRFCSVSARFVERAPEQNRVILQRNSVKRGGDTYFFTVRNANVQITLTVASCLTLESAP